MAEGCTDLEVVKVLQRRHLYKQPLEYLVKCRIEPGRYKDKWLSQAVLVTLKHGQSLIRQFKKTKVGQMGVDAYLGKRRCTARKSRVATDPQASGEPSSNSNQPSHNHVLPTMDSAVLGDGKTKGAFKTNRDSARGKNNGHDVGSSHSSSTTEQQVLYTGSAKQLEKPRVTSNKFKDLHLRSPSLLAQLRFDNHNSKSVKNSNLRRSAPPFSGQMPQKKTKTPEKNNSVGSVAQPDSLAILSDPVSITEDDVVSVSSESSDEVLYSLAQLAREEAKNGERDSGDVLQTKRKRRDASGSSKKLRVAEARAFESPESDSKVNFKLSTSAPNSTHTKSSSNTDKNLGSMSILAVTPVSCGGVTAQSASWSFSDGTNPSESKHQNTTAAAFESIPKQRRKKNHVSSDDEVQIERRISVRQTESAFRFKEIVVRKCSKYMHLVTLSQTPAKNAFNPKVFHELTLALRSAVNDDSRVVLLSASGNMFSSGIDLNYLLNCEEDRKQAAKNMATSLRDFINCLISFPKPIVVAVNGPAIGLGMAILPLCDIIYASDKACFSCPYTALCQTPEGCSSYTFPKMMGMAMANELLLRGRKITALEANQIGLITQVFWPDNLMSEVTPRVQHLAAQSLKALECTKALMRASRRTKLECVNATECQMLVERWTSNECQRAMKLYLEQANDLS